MSYGVFFFSKGKGLGFKLNDFCIDSTTESLLSLNIRHFDFPLYY